MIMKSPSMRSAKMAASDTIARNSGAERRVDVADGLDIRNGKRMRVASGLACDAARRGRLVLARNGTIWGRTASRRRWSGRARHAHGQQVPAPADQRASGLGARALRPLKVVIVAGLAPSLFDRRRQRGLAKEA